MCAIFLALPFLLGASEAALFNRLIPTQNGDVVGYPAFNSSPAGNLSQWQDITVWKGIPFAASTGGENRFRPPQPAPGRNSTLYASAFGPVCPASTMNSEYAIDEDCLSLNIWSAANSSSDRLPVVMWSYPAGSTARDSLFDGGGMADKDVVFVNYNYRTGAFGWLAHPDLNEEMLQCCGTNSSGNWGLLDQFAALKWIRQNIVNFGGDPDRVTVMGQSAGSAASYRILNSPLTKGDIVGAIIESGVRDPHDPLAASTAQSYISLEESLLQGEKFLDTYLNVSTIAEARKLPYTDLVTSLATLGSTSEWSFEACLDGYAMPSTYFESLIRGAANQVPVLTGNTKDESGATYGLNISQSTYFSDLQEMYNGTWIQRFLEQYPANDSTTASGAENSQYTDRSKVGTYLWTQLWKTASAQPVWTYFWNHAPPGQNQGAYHESEINYVLNNLYDTDLPWTSSDYAIARTMNSYWVNFIKTQNPNGADVPVWPETGCNNSVQVVGDSFGQDFLVTPSKLELYKEWFAGLKLY
ncbi:alpha/beta-hydrolase [Hortaea werneckii]|nr:alpha/beta-hydrolase [Hortaea werneckii]